MIDRVAQLRELIILVKRRKFELDKQAVILGITVDPKVLLEREDLQRELEIYEAELSQLGATEEPDEMTAASIDIRPADLRQAVADAREVAQQAQVQAAQAQVVAQDAQTDVAALLVELRPLGLQITRLLERFVWLLALALGAFGLAMAALIIALLK